MNATSQNRLFLGRLDDNLIFVVKWTVNENVFRVVGWEAPNFRHVNEPCFAPTPRSQLAFDTKLCFSLTSRTASLTALRIASRFVLGLELG
ncbi:MAG TPA: hypothetical protein DHU55_19710 [Blastocatellia bacterium]|jgi:hypothetical protein|nr:hypothetical protein [Blastocatellia bacterium]HAF24993.1 hypothetical protein [Blastocatellia bacterium]HCX31971.1 hypothetical protein [Blastocatellia bacterium]